MPPQRGEPAATWQSRRPPPEAPEGSPAAVRQGRPRATAPQKLSEPENLTIAVRLSPAAVRLDAPQKLSDPENLKKAVRLSPAAVRLAAPQIRRLYGGRLRITAS